MVFISVSVAFEPVVCLTTHELGVQGHCIVQVSTVPSPIGLTLGIDFTD